MATEASEVEVCNLALLKLGQVRIASLEDGTELANKCAAILPMVRRFVLAQHPWPCAMDRQVLARRATGPDFGWLYAYALPADCLRPVALEEDRRANGGYPWEWEGASILTDAETASLHYIKDLEDFSVMEVGVLTVMAARLAWVFSYSFLRKATLTAECKKDLREVEAEAGIMAAASDNTTIAGLAGDSGLPKAPGSSWAQTRKG